MFTIAASRSLRDPFLTSLASLLVGDHDATAALLVAYNDLLVDRLKCERGIAFDGSAVSVYKEEAKEQWFASLNHLASRVTAILSGPKIPPFEETWAEALLFLLSYRHFSDSESSASNYDWFLGEEENDGLHCERIISLILADLRANSKLAHWIETFIKEEPRYVDRPPNLPEQLRARTTNNSIVFLDLDRAINSLRTDYDAILTVIGFFGNLVFTATNYVQSQDADMVEEPNEDAMQALIQALRDRITIFSESPLKVRQQLCHMNIRGTFSLLLRDTANLANDSRSELHWRMFQRLVHSLHHTAITHNCEKAVKEALESYGLGIFFSLSATPLPDWDCEVFEDIMWQYQGDDQSDEEDFNFDDLPDDFFEPCGPEIKVANHTTAVANAYELPEQDCSICLDTLDTCSKMRENIPVKIKCGHCFHYGCLKTLINGVANYSNACPHCRQVICPPREKRLKCEKEINEMLTSSTGGMGAESDTMESRSHLRDKEGDVVMTDD